MDGKFEEVYKTHFRDIYTYVYRIVGNRQVAEDITQDVFCAALNLGDKFLNHPNQKGWLMVAAKNKLCELRRRMKHRASQPLDDKLELGASESEYKEIDLELTALGVLNEEEWSLIKDYYVRGITIGELAERYGITENNMRVRLYRMKLKVRKAIE